MEQIERVGEWIESHTLAEEREGGNARRSMEKTAAAVEDDVGGRGRVCLPRFTTTSESENFPILADADFRERE